MAGTMETTVREIIGDLVCGQIGKLMTQDRAQSLAGQAHKLIAGACGLPDDAFAVYAVGPIETGHFGLSVTPISHRASIGFLNGPIKVVAGPPAA